MIAGLTMEGVSEEEVAHFAIFLFWHLFFFS